MSAALGRTVTRQRHWVAGSMAEVCNAKIVASAPKNGTAVVPYSIVTPMDLEQDVPIL